MSGFRKPDEERAATIVARLLGAEVRSLEEPGKPSSRIDAEVVYPDGRTAALEFTDVEDRDRHWLHARIDKLAVAKPAPGKLMWTIRPQSVDEIDRLRRIHERVILVCEEYGAWHPQLLPYDVIAADDDLRWLAWDDGRHLRLMGHEMQEPKVYWMHPQVWAVWDNEADEIAKGVAEALQVEPCVGHLAKLLDDPHDERHLFLLLGATGLGSAAAFSLIEPKSVPTVDPAMPEGVDHLWLAPGWGTTVTIWSRGRGWRNERVRD